MDVYVEVKRKGKSQVKMFRFKVSKFKNAAPKIPKREVGIYVSWQLPANTICII